MSDLWTRLKQRKLVQWALAYVAGAWALLQVLDLAVQSYGWTHRVMPLAFGGLALGLLVTLVLAWYHGEQGRQRVSGTELLIVALLLAVGGTLLWRFTPRGTLAAAPVPATASMAQRAAPAPSTPAAAASSAGIPAKSIAVLPFENLSSDKNNAYFADGMQDLILTKLADIGQLQVVSRTSTMKYASHPDDLKTVGKQLGVATVLEGSVQKAGNQVLINVQLIDTRTDHHLWAQSYQRTLDNIFGVEGEVAQKIAAALDSKMSTAEQRIVAGVPTRNPDALDAYLRGKHDVDQAADDVTYTTLLPKAIRNFQRAVKLDPGYALAWAALAATQMENIFQVREHTDAYVREAEANARRALQLAPQLPEAHYAMGLVYELGQEHTTAALTQFRKAVELRPSYADPARIVGLIELDDKGDLVNSVREFQRAVALDPNSADYASELARAYFIRGNYAASRRISRRVIALAPNNIQAYSLLSEAIFYQTGDPEAALQILHEIPADAPSKGHADHDQVYFLVMQKKFTAARQVISHFRQRVRESEDPGHADFMRGYVEWYAGHKNAARPYLLKALSAFNKLSATSHFKAGYALVSAQVLAMLGHANEALKKIQVAMRIDGKQGHHTPAYTHDLMMLAAVQVYNGDHDGAINTLKGIVASDFRFMLSPVALKADPTWAPLRPDLRFQALLKHFEQLKPLPVPGGQS